MVPGTANRIADHQALGQRATVVGASGAGGEQLLALLHQHHRLTTGVPSSG
jgi:5,10-methylene-tetrahydrofolate dehydrogenase/methenyl tetrahydrofolate cyclohydrolase